MIYLSIDPSISCTGYGLLHDDGSTNGRVIECGTIKPPDADSGSPWTRIRDGLLVDLSALVGSLLLAHEINVVIVETPQEWSKGLGGKRSAATLPTYGMAVGAVLAELESIRKDMSKPFTLLETSASEWTRSAPAARTISTSGRRQADPNKTARVEYVRALWPTAVLPTAKDKAGGAADALLMAKWQMDQQRNVRKTA